MQTISRRIWSQKMASLLRHIKVIQHSKSSLSDDASRQDDGFFKVPMGESDLGEQTRLSFVSKDMKESGKTRVASISADGFRIGDGSFLFGPIAVFPKTVLSWRVSSPEEITEKSLELFFMLQPKLDCLVIGAGDQENVDKVRRNLAGLISRESVGFEIMATEHAISTFNFLNAESRYVAAALFPPQNLAVSKDQHGRSMNMVRNSLELDESYLFDLDVKGDNIASLCGRIFGKNTEEALAMEKKIRKIQEETIRNAESNELIKEQERHDIQQEFKERLSEVKQVQSVDAKKIDDK